MISVYLNLFFFFAVCTVQYCTSWVYEPKHIFKKGSVERRSAVSSCFVAGCLRVGMGMGKMVKDGMGGNDEKGEKNKIGRRNVKSITPSRRQSLTLSCRQLVNPAVRWPVNPASR